MRASPQQDGADDLAILHPQRAADIGGRNIVMREYGFVEGMRLQPLIAPIVEQIAALANGSAQLDQGAFIGMFAGPFADSLTVLIARACDQPVEWVQGLNDAAGKELFALWWLVNQHFFTRRVVDAVMLQTAMRARSGAASTPRSSPQATTPGNSETTPTVN